ncbi:MAG: hypothetical protein J5J00_11915 [Deltaproteobacteria bacterium]|nr:hypothetical protein [Deltaproteobacteria bacterium]
MKEVKVGIVIGAAGLSSALSIGWNDMRLPPRPMEEPTPVVRTVAELDAEIKAIIDQDKKDFASVLTKLKAISNEIADIEKAVAEHVCDNTNSQTRALSLNIASAKLSAEIRELENSHASEQSKIARLEKIVISHEATISKLEKQNTSLGKKVKKLSTELDEIKDELSEIRDKTSIMSEMNDIVRSHKEEYVNHEREQKRKQRARNRQSDSRLL